MRTQDYTIPESKPDLPFIYLDWNVVQYLFREDSFSPILEAVTNARLNGAAIIPYSSAHISDATALWNHVHEYHSVRHRMLYFLGGLSGNWCWKKQDDRFTLGVYDIVQECESTGQFSSINSDANSDSVAKQHLAEVNQQLAQQLKSARAQAEALASENPDLEDVMKASSQSLEAAFANGVPEISDSSSMFMSVMAPFWDHLREQETYQVISHLDPSVVVSHIEERFRLGFPIFEGPARGGVIG